MAHYYYHQTIIHEGLHKHKTIGANSRRELEYKVSMQQAQWNEQWLKKQESDRKKADAAMKRQERARLAADNEKAMQLAKQQTEEADNAQTDIDNILIDRSEGVFVDFETLKRKDKFAKLKPAEPVLYQYNKEPNRMDAEFNPKMGLFTKLSKTKKQQFNENNENAFIQKHKNWELNCREIDENNKKLLDDYKIAEEEWFKSRDEFEKEQEEYNLGIDDFKNGLLNCDPDSVIQMAGLIYDKVELPFEDFETSFEIEYVPENKNLIVDAYLPTVENMPILKNVSYVKSKQEFKETYYTEAQVKKKYDVAIYQIALMFLKYGFCLNQYGDIVDAITVNGIINTIDKTTGNAITAYVMSVRTDRSQFENLNLTALDPKAWFRSAKGVAAASIATVTPIQPVQMLNKEDHRFVEGYEVLEGVNDGVNLAAIDWQDFENLIREIFEEEFSSNGGEVKVTQASRDGGVDAICFDPDPIRGGKIVIQAKRYTNVVGVSAVRDLYGTLMNEGAMKGILVTTSYFGNDAFDFASGKPIQLISGAQLLGLLEKHGHKATIDLKEAKKLLR